MNKIDLSKYDELVHKAIEAAENKHPNFPADPVGMTSIMMEEAGEAAREANKIVYDKDGKVEDLRKEVLHTACVCYRILEALDEMPISLHTREILDDVYWVAQDLRGTECTGVPQYLCQVAEDCWQLSSISGATELTPEKLKKVQQGGSIAGFDELKAVKVSKLYKVEE